MYYAQLRAFHAVATYGGFSKAAAQLNVTQPALSDQVKKLEERFGVLLFNRQKRSVEPTELGQRLLQITRRQFEMESEAVELLTESQALRTGEINISADSPLHVIHMIADFKARFPGITVTLKIGNSGNILKSIEDYSADIGVVGRVAQDDRLHIQVLRCDPLVAFVTNTHHWAQHKSISLRQLANEPLVMREQGSSTRAALEADFARAGLTPRVALEVEGREAAREAVAAGIGVGVVSEPEFGFDSRVTSLTIKDGQQAMTEHLVALKGRCHLRLIRAFLDTAQQRLNTPT